MGGVAGVTMRFRPPLEAAWSINEERRRHWSWRRNRVEAWRQTTYFSWRSAANRAVRQAWPRNTPALVTVSLPVKGDRKRDPSNYLPAVKAVVDGLVDAGLWPDDTPEWVAVAEPVLVPGADVVTVQLNPM